MTDDSIRDMQPAAKVPRIGGLESEGEDELIDTGNARSRKMPSMTFAYVLLNRRHSSQRMV